MAFVYHTNESISTLDDLFSSVNATDHEVTTPSDPLTTANVTVPWSGFDPPEQQGHSCALRTDYGIVAGIIASICFLFGIVFTFFGYRFLKATLFLTGFLLTSVLCYMILEEQGDSLPLPPQGILGCSVGAGVLIGLLGMLVPKAGLAMTGIGLAAGVTAVIFVVVEQGFHPPSRWIPVGVFLVLGIVFGGLSMKFPRGIAIVGTSVIGSAASLAGIDYFLELSRGSLYVWERIMVKESPELCWSSWIMLGLWPPLSILGMVVQSKCTGQTDANNGTAWPSNSEETAHLQQGKSEDRRETQQTRYRHLYQARRVRGDVISQDYIHSIQHKLSPAMQSLTALNVEGGSQAGEEESTATTMLTQVT